MLLFHVFSTKERFGIQRIDVFGEAAISELRISLDGVSFDSVDTVVNNEKLNASLYIVYSMIILLKHQYLIHALHIQKVEIKPALPSLGVSLVNHLEVVIVCG